MTEIVTGPRRDGSGLRVSDAERTVVADRLLAAHGEGRLTLAEFDERVRRAHGATVRADLAGLTADLPAPAPGPTAAAPRPDRGPRPGPPALPVPPGLSGPCGGGDLRTMAAVWGAVSVLNVVIWLAVVAGAGHGVYPWWIWVAGPWGAVLLLRALTTGSSGTGAQVASRSLSGG